MQDETVQIAGEEVEIKPCPICMAPNDSRAVVCINCASAFGKESFFGGGKVVTAEGPVWARPGLTSPKTEVVFWQIVTLWIIVVPAMTGIAIYVVSGLRAGIDSEGIKFLLLGVGFESLSFFVLRNYTRYYRHTSAAKRDRVA